MPFCPKRGILHSKTAHFKRAEIFCRRNKVSLLQSRGILSEQQSVSAFAQRSIVEAAKYCCVRAEIYCQSNKILLRLSREALSDRQNLTFVVQGAWEQGHTPAPKEWRRPLPLVLSDIPFNSCKSSIGHWFRKHSEPVLVFFGFIIQQHIRLWSRFLYFGLKILIIHTVGIANPNNQRHLLLIQ